MTATPQTNASLTSIATELASRDNFVICGHVSPDGDCIGSQLALMHTLRALGKNATCVLVKPDPLDANLMFMPGADDLIPACEFSGPVSTFVAVDVPTRERIGEDACKLLDAADFSITIDHHAVDARMTDLDYTDPDSASTTMMIWSVCNMLMDTPPVESALCAYTGLVTDTGCFQFQNTDGAAFESASSMVAAGVRPSDVARNVMQDRSLASLKLASLAIDRMVFTKGGAGVVSYVTKEDMERLGAVKSDAEPLVNTLRSVRGVKVAAMLREQDDNIRGSLRAKDDSDVSVIARAFNGGGHKAAAGCRFDCSVEEAVKQMLSAFEEAFE